MNTKWTNILFVDGEFQKQWRIIRFANIYNIQANKCQDQNHGAFEGQRACIIRLIQSEADVNMPVQRKNYSLIARRTPLMFASISGDLDSMNILIAGGANVNLEEETGEAALYYEACYDHENCLDLLIEKGADMNRRGQWQKTAMMAAATQGNSNCVEKLIKKEGNVNSSDHNGQTVLHYAIQAHDNKCVTNLIKVGADVNCSISNCLRRIHASVTSCAVL